MTPSTAEVIRDFVVQHLLDEPFSGEDPLAELDLDSLALEQLIDFLEEEYRILLDDEDTHRSHFRGCAELAAVVDARRRAWHGGA